MNREQWIREHRMQASTWHGLALFYLTIVGTMFGAYSMMG